MKKIIKLGSPEFYINRNRYVETYGEYKVGVRGIYTGRAIKRGETVREFSMPAPNLITNLGLDNLGVTPVLSRMHLGTGTTTPAFTDTALATFGVNVQNAGGTDATGNSGSSPYYGWLRRTWISAVGGATGNWTEIGVSNQNTTGNLRSRALILDGGGSPTVFPVLADEQFEGTYELRFYVPLSDSVDAITLSGTPYDVTTRAASASGTVWIPKTVRPPFAAFGAVTAYTGALGAITAANPGGASLGNASSFSGGTYTNGNYYLDSTARWGSGSGVGTVRSLMMGFECARLQMEYNPTFAKLTTEEFIHNQRVIWARI